MEKITPNIEDYLEAILVLSQENGYARVKDISQMLNITNPSVTQQIQRLVTMNLVKHQSYGAIVLTEKGKSIGIEILNRHSMLKDLLKDVLNLPNNIAEQSACKMEHSIELITFNRFKYLLEFIRKENLCNSFHSFLIESEKSDEKE